MKASELKPNPRNPRKITDQQLEILRGTLAQFGSLDGIVKNRTTGNLIGGHQRTKIFADASVTIEREHKKPTKLGTVSEGFVLHEGERFPYREVVWDKTRELAAVVAANKAGGEFDLPALTELLSELDTGETDLTMTGFTLPEIEELMTAAHPGLEPVAENGLVDEKTPVVCPECGLQFTA